MYVDGVFAAYEQLYSHDLISSVPMPSWPGLSLKLAAEHNAPLSISLSHLAAIVVVVVVVRTSLRSFSSS